MGRSYLIDHCVRYHNEKINKLNFQISVAENTRGLLGFLTGKWEEIPSYVESISPKKQKEEKEVSADEVITGIKQKLSRMGG